ncbi:MAG: response regulator [Planctomycetota bacterium]|nr:MAG: response regulator [Planctomycetota bacterium]
MGNVWYLQEQDSRTARRKLSRGPGAGCGYAGPKQRRGTGKQPSALGNCLLYTKGAIVHAGRVLIAMADRSLLAAYCEALADGGYAVAAATDGISCLNLLRDAAPDVAVLDRALPWGGGDGVLALMRQEPSYLRVPVIAFTTRADEALCTFMALPVEMYLPTPPTPQSLTTTVRTLLYRQRSSLRADTAAGHAVRPGRAHAGEPKDLPWTIQANRNHPADFS